MSFRTWINSQKFILSMKSIVIQIFLELSLFRSIVKKDPNRQAPISGCPEAPGEKMGSWLAVLSPQWHPFSLSFRSFPNLPLFWALHPRGILDGFMVLRVFWFYSCMALWRYTFMVVWCHGFLVSKIYQMSISCFQEDIDLISKIFKIWLDGSSGFSAPVFSKIAAIWISIF